MDKICVTLDQEQINFLKFLLSYRRVMVQEGIEFYEEFGCDISSSLQEIRVIENLIIEINK